MGGAFIMIYKNILENCPTPHIYLKVIKDDKSKIIDVEIIHTNLYIDTYSYKHLIDKIKNQEGWDEVLQKTLQKGKIRINRYLGQLQNYTIADLHNTNGDYIIIWLSKDEAFEKQKDTIYEMTYDHIPDAIFFKSVDGRYIKCNESYAKLLRMSKDEIVGKINDDIPMIQCFDKNIKEIDNEIIKSKVAKTYYTKLTYPDGTYVEVETKKIPFFDEKNRVIGLIGTARDIRHRKEEEKELDKLRMQFFANLSHEFRTPINLIFSSLQLINRLSINEDSDRKNTYGRYFNIIKQNSYRLSKLVNNLMDSTKISSGYFEYTPQNYDIISYIESICMAVAQYASQRDVEIIFDTDIEEHIISFDLKQIERIILNLLSNAIKFSESNGKIFINIHKKEEYVEVKVKDEGIGISQDKLEDVFKIFKQVNNRMTKISEGSGIGLSLVKSLVEMHGGYIYVESKENEGSEFIFGLPNRIIDETVNSYLNIQDDLTKSRFIENIKIEFSDIY